MWPWPQGYRNYDIPHSRCVYPQIGKMNPVRHGGDDGIGTAWAIAMPYISYEDSATHQAIVDLTKKPVVEMKKLTQGSTETTIEVGGNPTSIMDRTHARERQAAGSTAPEDVQSGIIQVMKGYLEGKKGSLPLHPRRTLDQSYYYTLKDTSDRDTDQVVSRWIRKLNRSGGESSGRSNILMVDQLWLWYIKKTDENQADVVITSFPNRDSMESKLDDMLLNDKNRDPFFCTGDLVAQIMTECCKTLSLDREDPALRFVEFFEGAIGRVEEKETKLLKKFGSASKELSALDEPDPRSPGPKRLRSQPFDIMREVQLLTEVKDILDEIKMIKTVLADQKSILDSDRLDQLSKVLCGEKSPADTSHSRDRFSKPKELVERAMATFDNMKRRAEAVEHGLISLLDLKQKQTNVWEARMAREGAEETAKQGMVCRALVVLEVDRRLC
ncbi:hypothetical protein VTK73DRAFT_10370 [Phialemonium thermophilum]|uniref:Uncharacterized protein n=1 Tax=Phialemonium thermophilum TaxID=223376 RepID=A0ABR3VXD3_9PEZI